jgi:hypothetical protein
MFENIGVNKNTGISRIEIKIIELTDSGTYFSAKVEGSVSDFG